MDVDLEDQRKQKQTQQPARPDVGAPSPHRRRHNAVASSPRSSATSVDDAVQFERSESYSRKRPHGRFVAGLLYNRLWKFQAELKNLNTSKVRAIGPPLIGFLGICALIMSLLSLLFTQDAPSSFTPKPAMVGHIITDYANPFQKHSTQFLSVVRIDPQTHRILQQEDRKLLVAIPNSKEQSTTVAASEIPKIQWITTTTSNNKRLVDDLGEGLYMRQHIAFDSDDFERNKPRSAPRSNCELPYAWQNHSFPTCNNLHEQGMMDHLQSQSKFFLGKGSYRTVFLLDNNINNNGTITAPTITATKTKSPDEKVVLKVMNIKQDWSEDSIDRHRRDALISERLTSSPRVTNVYSYCGNSALYEYASGGALYDAIGAVEWHDDSFDDRTQKALGLPDHSTWSVAKKMNLAYQAVAGLADLHQLGVVGNNRALVAHGDIDITQFVSSDGGQTYKINDFNGAQWVYYSGTSDKACPFHPAMGGGKTRSPEEYDDHRVTEKVDIYGIGYVLFSILVGKYPFHDISYSKVKDKVVHGQTPYIPDSYQRSKDPNIQALIHAMKLCWVWNPSKRASARQVEEYLRPFAIRSSG